MHALRAWCVATLLLLISAHSAFAQAIRGRVVADGTGTPLAGAIVQARSGDGTIIASTLTSERGAIAIASLPDATYTLRILRIGFRPFDSSPIVVANGTSEPITVSWIGNAVPLTTQVITGGRTCKVSADSGTMISNVWTETRKALLSSILAEEGVAPVFVRLNYARTVELKDELIQQQRLTTEARRTFRAYASWPAESLSVNGYTSEGVFAGQRATVYRAPDASTLVAESFAATHCFSLVKGVGAHAGHIGLAFEPFDRKTFRVDIRGTFWIEQSSSRLQRIDFSYVGLPSIANPAKSGGYVEFASLTSGQWLLSRWHIRMPHFVVPHVAGLEVAQQRLDAVDETGGVVLSVAQGDTVLYSSTMPVLTARVINADFLKELSGTKVELTGTDLRATTNAEGRVIFRNLVPGRYQLRAAFPALAMFSALPRDQHVTIDSVDKEAPIETPQPLALLRTACGRNAERSGMAAVFGSVRDTSGFATNTRDGLIVARPLATTPNMLHPAAGALLDHNGQYVICTQARGEFLLSASNTFGEANRNFHVATDAMLQEVPLQLTPLNTPDSVANTRTPLATVEFRVIDSEALVVPRIRVMLSDANGVSNNVNTDMTGRAFLLDVPVGSATVRAGPGSVSQLMLKAGHNLITIVLPEPHE